ncbi:thiol-disulfide oxidoreductase ResA [Paludifilum halophilum]|uniref:Thiol-disulfide oxidoreductase n=1 Tax=Paludifilum halophilum TaxID=1642702 RepID=A0A235B699_9BACL|nr:thiol-disulfide oxidoreductase ResA [Paludifilum halophilum]OYD07834.1 thiol-disulfide oxidoreductase [Paludifilum halophilum]
MNKQMRYWIRRILLVVMAGMVAFALYQTISGKQSKSPEVGEKAPDFELKTLDGETMKLSDLRGQAVLINFWATWCEPCRDEMPAIQNVYDRYKEQGFEVVAVNIAEAPVSVRGFARQLELDFPILLDRDRKVTNQYDIGPIPSSLLIDQEGKVVRKHSGQMQEKQIEGYVREALAR